MVCVAGAAGEVPGLAVAVDILDGVDCEVGGIGHVHGERGGELAEAHHVGGHEGRALAIIFGFDGI